MPRQPPITIELATTLLSTWLQDHSDASLARQAETLPLRRDMVTLLAFKITPWGMALLEAMDRFAINVEKEDDLG